MLPKPKQNTNGTAGRGCEGCIFWGDGKGFVPDLINNQAPTFVVAQNPGESEERGERLIEYKYGQPIYEPCEPQPMVGKTGFAMQREYFPIAGLTRDNVSLGNALRCRINHKDMVPPLKNVELRTALAHCHYAHFKLPEKTQLVVAQGELGLYAMTQEGLDEGVSITSCRGWVLPYTPLCNPRVMMSDIWTPTMGGGVTTFMPVLAVNHVAYIFRYPTAAMYAKSDWAKIPRILAGTWPRKPTSILDVPPVVLPRRFAFDTEFILEKDRLLRYSMAYPTLPTNELCVRVVEREVAEAHIFPTVLFPPLVIAHHIMADIGYLEDLFNLKPGDYRYDDSMHMHSVLWAGLDHDLDTLGSLYAPINRWKHLEASNPRVYSGGDAEGTYYSWASLERELNADQGSRRIYDDIQIKLVKHIRKSKRIGIKVLQEPSVQIAKDLQEKVDELQIEAEALVGWPINLKSDLMTAQQLFDSERLLEWALPKKKVRK
ncbi:hypothetical protein LCGC14_0474340 [marine sediment metagenome]|uniref:Uncharacterized protein n=1 Tax=marine sediment metagenome TaxID=412755 RepID=A0A0F9SGG2_9ZZZZ